MVTSPTAYAKAVRFSSNPAELRARVLALYRAFNRSVSIAPSLANYMPEFYTD
jgi:hypothetical protein